MCICLYVCLSVSVCLLFLLFFVVHLIVCCLVLTVTFQYLAFCIYSLYISILIISLLFFHYVFRCVIVWFPYIIFHILLKWRGNDSILVYYFISLYLNVSVSNYPVNMCACYIFKQNFHTHKNIVNLTILNILSFLFRISIFIEYFLFYFCCLYFVSEIENLMLFFFFKSC